MNTPRSRIATNSIAGLLLAVAVLLAPTVHAVSDCGIGLKSSTVAPTIDGLAGTGEWTDAAVSVMDSNSPCFGKLMDFALGAANPYPLRDVTVKSKRYQRGTDWFLGFLFEVQDSSNIKSPGGGNLNVGEKIVMHFNRTINGDQQIRPGEDARFTVSHKWVTPGSPPSWCTTGTTTDCVQTEVTTPIADSNIQPALLAPVCPAVSGVDTKWGAKSSFPGTTGITVAIRKGLAGGGYRAEIEVPVNFITGTTANASDLPADIGVAFAVVNDFGSGSPLFCATPPCNGAAASFPPSLPKTNGANPVDATCDKGWVVPAQWGVGYLTNPPGQVTISRLDQWWDSNAIEVFECSTAGYTYYPSKPCRIMIKATLKNTGATATRKVVFLWAKHGSGDPLEYNFVDFQSKVVAAGSPMTPGSTPVDSILWAGMPKNELNHPCLRVYIFPDTLSAADEALLRGTASGGVVTKATLDPIVANNQVEEQHWAQKNISRHTTATECPDPDCKIGSLAPLFRFGLVSIAAAAYPAARPNEASRLLSEADWKRYAADHVIVRIRTVAFRMPDDNQPRLYNLMEDFGGVVQAFQAGMFREKKEVPVSFQISNGSASNMRVEIFAEVHTPAGVKDAKIDLGRQELALEGRSVTTVNGKLTVAGVESQCYGLPDFVCERGRSFWIILLLILLGIIGFVLLRRR